MTAATNRQCCWAHVSRVDWLEWSWTWLTVSEADCLHPHHTVKPLSRTRTSSRSHCSVLSSACRPFSASPYECSTPAKKKCKHRMATEFARTKTNRQQVLKWKIALHGGFQIPALHNWRSISSLAISNSRNFVHIFKFNIPSNMHATVT